MDATTSKAKLSPVSDLLKKSWAIFTLAANKFIWLQVVPVFIGLVPMAIVVSAWGFIRWLKPAGLLVQFINVGFGFFGLIALVFFVYISVLSAIAPYALIQDPRNDRTFKELLLLAKPFAWVFIAVSLLYALIIVGGILLLIIPGIYWAVNYAFAHLVVYYEKTDAKQALKRSKELVSGYWWPIFGRFAAIGLIQIVLRLPVYLFPQSQQGAANFVIGLLNFSIAPVFLIYTYVLYQELGSIKSNKIAPTVAK